MDRQGMSPNSGTGLKLLMGLKPSLLDSNPILLPSGKGGTVRKDIKALSCFFRDWIENG